MKLAKLRMLQRRDCLHYPIRESLILERTG